MKQRNIELPEEILAKMLEEIMSTPEGRDAFMKEMKGVIDFEDETGAGSAADREPSQEETVFEFFNRLRRTLNHLQDVDHVALHAEILNVAKGIFSYLKDDRIEDWLHTEDMHQRDFLASKKQTKKSELYELSPEDLRADTDRTLFCTLQYIFHNKKWIPKLEKFRSELEPKLKGLEPKLSPDLTMNSIGRMPWDSAHAFHTVLANQLSMVAPKFKREKVLSKKQFDEYLGAVSGMDEYFWSFGGDLFKSALEKCNAILTDIYDSLSNYIARARIRTSQRFVTSTELVEHIDALLASM